LEEVSIRTGLARLWGLIHALRDAARLRVVNLIGVSSWVFALRDADFEVHVQIFFL